MVTIFQVAMPYSCDFRAQNRQPDASSHLRKGLAVLWWNVNYTALQNGQFSSLAGGNWWFGARSGAAGGNDMMCTLEK